MGHVVIYGINYRDCKSKLEKINQPNTKYTLATKQKHLNNLDYDDIIYTDKYLESNDIKQNNDIKEKDDILQEDNIVEDDATEEIDYNIIDNDITEDDTTNEDIKPVNTPRGWHLKNEFIDDDGNIFHKGEFIGNIYKEE